MESLRNDIGYAIRTLAKKPGFTLIAVLTLALGIGANAAIFSMVNSAVFQPLPFAEPDQIVRIFWTNREQGIRSLATSHPDLTDLAATSQHLDVVAAFMRTGVNFTGAGEPERLQA
ncbi:MAG TPA: ABC transporter permease, partial [Candidatus Acidoferrales bacterium]